MCGIAGLFSQIGAPIDENVVIAMRDSLTHRGPDDKGLFVGEGIGLGHRRLSIIDLSSGHQPIKNEDGSVVVIFNGEIYNFPELRKQLLLKGHQFSTHSDTEVIVHLYEERGMECLQELRGMFAFALWDANRKQLFLARDRVGEKPLYYSTNGDTIAFASEIKAILRANLGKIEPDPIGLRRFLTFRHTYGSNTLFSGIRQLLPGHYLQADADGCRVHQYWNLPERDGDHTKVDSSQVLTLLTESVSMRLISDVPLGVFLSGGIDSSVITALMAKQVAKVRSFSIGFVPGDENELHWAKRVATAFATDHHEFILKSDDYFTLLKKLIWHHDEPLAFPASIPLYLLSRESKQVATVMLAGEGADELFAGYGNNIRAYWLHRMRACLPAPIRQALTHFPLPKRVVSVVGRLNQSEAELISSAFRLPGHTGLLDACRIALPAADADDHSLASELGFAMRRGSFLDKFLYVQFKTYLSALLMKQDKMSMAASIETRVPFLDHKLVELAFQLPDAAKVRGLTGKHILRQAAKSLLPSEIIGRRKMGFPVPIDSWFRATGNPFIEVLLDPSSLQDGYIDARYVQTCISRFMKGAPLSLELWTMLNLELWRRRFLT